MWFDGLQVFKGAYRPRVWDWEANFMLRIELYSLTKVNRKDPGPNFITTCRTPSASGGSNCQIYTCRTPSASG